MAADFSHVSSFRITFSLILLQNLENCFEVSTDDEGNLELVLPTMESLKEIWFRHVYSHHFMVFAILKVLVPGGFIVKSLEAILVEVLLMSVTTITTPE